jgi:hypothetical protein
VSIPFKKFVDIMDTMQGRLAKNINKAMKKNALRMEAAAKLNATTFPRVIDNRLRSSIMGTVINFQEDDYLILRAGGLTAPNRPFSESADVVYAAVQEFGGGPNRIIPKFYLKRARDKIEPIFRRDLEAASEAALKGESY